jgi:hypothetical protein
VFLPAASLAERLSHIQMRLTRQFGGRGKKPP